MSPATEVFDLAALVRVLRRRVAWLAVPVVVVLALAAVANQVATREYTSRATVLVAPFQLVGQSLTGFEESFLRDATVETERFVVTSAPVGEAVIAGLDANLGNVRVSVIRGTHVLAIDVTTTSPDRAAAEANAWATEYLGFREREAAEEVAQGMSALEARAAVVRGELDGLEGQDPETTAIQREVLVNALSDLTSQMALLAGGTGVAGGGTILQPAEPVETPTSPKPVQNLFIGGLLGMLLGIALALLRDQLDQTIGGPSQVTGLVPEARIIARIPRTEDEMSAVVSIQNPTAPVAEAYRTLAAGTRFLLAATEPNSPSGHGRSLMVTSPSPADGKSTIAANLAVALARANLRVILVDADLRRADLARRFHVSSRPGLTDLLVGDEQSPQRALVDVGVPKLRMLPAGLAPPNPTELLASPLMGVLHERLQAACDLVIYDSPPIASVSDPLELAVRVDEVLLVVRMEATRRRTLREAASQLLLAGKPPALVLNDVRLEPGEYGYGYGQGSDVAGGSAAATPTPRIDREPSPLTPPIAPFGDAPDLFGPRVES